MSTQPIPAHAERNVHPMREHEHDAHGRERELDGRASGAGYVSMPTGEANTYLSVSYSSRSSTTIQPMPISMRTTYSWNVLPM